MGLTRKENWPVLLDEAIKERANEPFKYGKHDCCLAACNCVLAMTGVDIAEEFRGYRSEKEAMQHLVEHKGVLGILSYLTKKFKIDEVSMLKAQRGDMAVVRTEKGVDAGGIIDTSGHHILSAAMPKGWKYHDIFSGIVFWRI